MLEIILALLLQLGLYGNKGDKPVTVIDQSTGISYGIGVSTGVGSSISMPSDTYYLVKDSTGKYRYYCLQQIRWHGCQLIVNYSSG